MNILLLKYASAIIESIAHWNYISLDATKDRKSRAYLWSDSKSKCFKKYSVSTDATMFPL